MVSCSMSPDVHTCYLVKGPFILQCNCVAVPIYWLLSAANHRSITSFKVEMYLIFMLHRNAVRSQLLCSSEQYGNATQSQFRVVWTDFNIITCDGWQPLLTLLAPLNLAVLALVKVKLSPVNSLILSYYRYHSFFYLPLFPCIINPTTCFVSGQTLSIMTSFPMSKYQFLKVHCADHINRYIPSSLAFRELKPW